MTIHRRTSYRARNMARSVAWAGAIGISAIIGFLVASSAWAAEPPPPAVDPFAAPPDSQVDRFTGRIELSDGSVRQGTIWLTRDKQLQIFDDATQRQREVPLKAVRQIDCQVKREWLEKEWRFKETTSDEKVYTGRSYPAREFAYTITLKDGRKISGTMSRILYFAPPPESPGDRPKPKAEPKRYLLQKRSKGEIGQDLKSLIYVKQVHFD